jgi:TRAP-type C4-dicarboxylate transport system permease small subunit
MSFFRGAASPAWLLIVNWLARLHDRITAVGFAGGALSVGLITVAFWYEVVARYFFNAPTTWAYDVASFLLCPTIFLSVPEMTRRNSHVVISYLVDALSPRLRGVLFKLLMLTGAVVCLICAWITGAETWRQYIRGVETITAVPILKWWVSIFIPYGMLSSSLYFMRQFAGPGPTGPMHQEAPS